MVICEKCGYKNQDGAVRCEHCGEVLVSDNGPVDNTRLPDAYVPPKSGKTSRIVVGVCVLLLVAVAAAGTILIREKLSEKSYREQIRYGNKYLESLNYEEAEESFRLALEMNPESEEAYVGLYQIYSQSGDPGAAVAILEQGIDVTDSHRLKTMLALFVGKNQSSDIGTVEASVHFTQEDLDAISEDLRMNTAFIQKLKNYTYLDYKKQFGDAGSERLEDGSVEVKYENFAGILLFRDTVDNDRIVDETVWRPFDEAVPSYLSLDDVASLFQNYAGGVTYNKLRMMNGGKILKEFSEEAGCEVVKFFSGECEIQVACDESGNITGNQVWNRIYPPQQGALDKKKGHVTGIVVDAVDGKGVPGASLTASPVGSGEKTAWETGTDGSYEVDMAEGLYQIEVKKGGYVTESFSLTVEKGQNNDAGTMSLSPVLEEGQIRIVLSWGASPRDLDSYLSGTSSDGHDVFVNFVNKSAGNGDTVFAQLDLDDTDGYGPETITIFDAGGTYDYWVFDYGKTGTIGGCQASVKIYLPGQPPVEYTVPQGEGNCWNVCRIENGKVTVINDITDPAGRYSPK